MFHVDVAGLEHHLPQLVDLCPPVSCLFYLDGPSVQEGVSRVFPSCSPLWGGPTHHSVCLWHESQGTSRGK